MALPWLIALGIGALVTVAVISTLADFFDKVEDLKKDYGALEAKIQGKLASGDHKKIMVGLRKKHGNTQIKEIEVSNEVASELREGQII